MRFVGGILLIVGTSIGGGMLALPVTNAGVPLWQSSLFLLICWAQMTLGAFFILEVNLYLPPGKHMVSMAAETVGMPGLIIAWFSYLFLLYTLLAAYISGGSDVLGGLLTKLGVIPQEWLLILLFTAAFGSIVYAGIRRVDLLNRLLMFAKLAVFLLLIILICPYMQLIHTEGGGVPYTMGSFMVLVTSFGFAIIVPNLRDYFNDDLRSLKRVILIGSLIPLVCYLAWDAVIIGSLPSKEGLVPLMTSAHTTSDLAALLNHTINKSIIASLFNFFTAICMLTAFLGVALCLMSFLADGLNLTQKGRQGVGLCVLTFIPPLLTVLYFPGAYLHALRYAGFFCVILLLFLPAWMSFCGRKKQVNTRFVVPGGVFSQGLLLMSSLILLALVSIDML